MDASVQRLLSDKLYDKRKQGALESAARPYFSAMLEANCGRERLERVVRESLASRDYDKIGKIVDELCHDYAYAVHQPHTRNGGLIGLAAASIALGSVSSSLLKTFGMTSPLTGIGRGRSFSSSDRSPCPSVL